MVAIITDVALADADTAGGTQAIPLSLGGATPIFVAIMAYRSTVDDDASGSGDSDLPVDHASFSWGCTDGTSEWAQAVSSETGQDPRSDTYQWLRSDRMVLIMDPADGSVDAAASWSAWGADSVTISWDTTPADRYKLVVFALAGTEPSAEVGTASSSGTLDGSVSVSHSLGEAPRGIAMAANVGSVNNVAATAEGRFGLGYASYDGSTIRQCGSAFAWYDAQAANIAARVSDEHIVPAPRFSGAPITEPARPQLEVTSVSSTAVGVTTRVVGASQDFGYAFIAGVECFAGLWQFPSGGGVKDFDMPAGADDVYPKGVLLSHSRVQTAEVSTNITNVRAGTFGWGAVGTDGSEGTGNVTMQRTQIPTVTHTFFDDNAFHNHPHTGIGEGNEGTWDNFDTDGWGIEVLKEAVNDVLFPQLLIGVFRAEPAGASVGLSPGEPTLAMTQALSPDGVSVGTAFGSPTLALLLAPDGTSVDLGFGSPSLALALSPDGLGLTVAVGQPSLILRLLPDGQGVGLDVGQPSLALTIGPTGVAVELAFGTPTVGALVVAGRAGTVVQSGMVAGTVSRSGMISGNVSQSGPVAGAVSQSGPVAGTQSSSGAVAGTVSQSGMVAGNVVS